MTKRLKMEHEIHGMVNEEETEIVGYVHERHKIGECPWCDFIRRENIVREFERRLECIEYAGIKSLNMWSLGTSLKASAYNHKVLLGWWRVFTRRVVRVSQWVPLFRVVETGRRGYLHVHVVCAQFVEHKKILEIWRDITGERSNVHVSGCGNRQDYTSLIRYLVKYLTKEGSKYRWMGPLYGLGSRTRRITNEKARGRKYGGVTCYTWTSEGYPVREPQRNIDK